MAVIRIDNKEYFVEPGGLLSDAIGLHRSMELPCGGKGKCGKCRVTARGDLSPVSKTEEKYLSSQEIEKGIRLACCTKVEGDCQVILPQQVRNVICTDGGMPEFEKNPFFQNYGGAIDIGTTTLAARLYSQEGLIAQASKLNPQSQYGADVISRIGQALDGKSRDIMGCIQNALGELLEEMSRQAGISVEEIDFLVVTGNTAMLYLLTGANPDCLSHAPFQASKLFGEIWTGGDLGLPCWRAQVYLPRCISAFVGADLTTALLASGLWKSRETALLADIGTNGEMILCHENHRYCCSTAAGPAFEGAGLSMGMSGKEGAVDHVFVEGKMLVPHIIGGGDPVGICGSGIVDALAAFLETEDLDESGLLEESPVKVAGSVSVSQQDVRMVQLAKSAICAGIRTLVKNTGLSLTQVAKLSVAGGFGSYLDIENAGKIGLIPQELTGRSEILGNAALTGAAMILLNKDFAEQSAQLARSTETVDLTVSPIFNEYYMEGMYF